jgi:hypothetical protein
MLLAGWNHYFKLLKHVPTQFKTTIAITTTMYRHMAHTHAHTDLYVQKGSTVKGLAVSDKINGGYHDKEGQT